MGAKVSIIIPVYNIERFIETCVNSVINQTYKELEIILVDDGSTDYSSTICEEMASHDNRIIVIHQANMGLSDARNTGIKLSTGDYLTFIDGDDFILPNMVKTLVSIAESNDCDIVEIGFTRCEEDENQIRDSKIEYGDVIVHNHNEIMKEYLTGKGVNTAAWGKLYKRELFHDIMYPSGKLHEDVFTTYKLLYKSQRVAISKQIGYIYRKTKKSITTAPFNVKKMDAIYGKIGQLEFINSHYPQLKKYAEADVVYSCNNVLRQMKSSQYEDEKLFNELKEYYKRYSKSYLFTQHSIVAKAFVIIATISPRLAYRI